MKILINKDINWAKIENPIPEEKFIMQNNEFFPGKIFDQIGESRNKFSIGLPLIYVGILDDYAVFKLDTGHCGKYEDRITKWYIVLKIIRKENYVHCLFCETKPGQGYDVRWKIQ